MLTFWRLQSYTLISDCTEQRKESAHLTPVLFKVNYVSPKLNVLKPKKVRPADFWLLVLGRGGNCLYEYIAKYILKI